VTEIEEDEGLPTVRVSVAEPVPLAFLALIVTVELPAADGVPLIMPVALLSERPAGRPAAP